MPGNYLTDAAAERMRARQLPEGKYVGVRIGVKKWCCAGMNTRWNMLRRKPLDEAVEYRGVKI